MQRVINFSGGKTSAYMTIHEYREGDLVIFCDTGREHPKTYKFIADFEAHEKIPVIKLQYGDVKIMVLKSRLLAINRDTLDGTISFILLRNELNKMVEKYENKSAFDQFLKDKNYKRIPNRMKRFCTEELKVNTSKRFLVAMGVKKYENLIGFRYDEPRRVLNHKEKIKKITTKFPLYEKQITKEMINEYWKNKPYNLEIPSILGNCTLCFMKGENAIMAILRSFPELADPWINDEIQSKKEFGHQYFPNTTIKQLRDRAQHNLFKDYDLGEISPAFSCACTT